LRAGGMESMTNIPFYVPKARFGYRYGNGEFLDGLVRDGLEDVYDKKAMGVFADATAKKYDISRQQQDEFAIRSYELAAEHTKNGAFKNEIIPVAVPQKKGDPILLAEDEEYKNVMFDKIPTLKPAFTPDGTVTFAKSEVYQVRLTVSNGSSTDIFNSTVNIGLANPTNLQIANMLNNGSNNYVINQVDLTWQDNSDETNFEVQRRINEIGNSFTTIATLPANTTSYSDNTIEDAKNYIYRVRATKGTLLPMASNTVTILTVSFITSLDEQLDKITKIYPNPASTNIQIELNSSDKVQNVTLFNQLGQKVLQANYTGEPIGVAHLPKGMYWVQIETKEQGKITKKLVLQ